MQKIRVILGTIVLVLLSFLFYKRQKIATLESPVVVNSTESVNEVVMQSPSLQNEEAFASKHPIREDLKQKPRKKLTLIDVLRAPESFHVSKEEIEAALGQTGVDEKFLLAAGLLLGGSPDGLRYLEQSFRKKKTRGSYIAMILSHPERTDLLSEFRKFDPENLVAEVLELKNYKNESSLEIIKRLESIKAHSKDKRMDWDQNSTVDSMSRLLVAMGYENEAANAIASLRFSLELKLEMFPVTSINSKFVSDYIGEEAQNQSAMSKEDKIKALDTLNYFLGHKTTLFDEILKTENEVHIANLKEDVGKVQFYNEKRKCIQIVKVQYNKVFSDMTYVEATDYFKTSDRKGELRALLAHSEVHLALERENCLNFFE